MTSLSDWTPKSIQVLRGYSGQKFFGDLIAGITVGLGGIPLAMAFAISSGLKPENGMYCAVVAGLLGALLSGSKTQISGPTGAFVVVVAGIVATHGVDGLFHVTMIAGVLLLILGLSGLGSAIKYIPRPVVIGFTNGIAVLIASTQIRDFLGLRSGANAGDFTTRMISIFDGIGTITIPATLTATLCFLLLIALRMFAPKLPATILVLCCGTAAVWALKLPIETVQSKFGGIPAGLPKLIIPTFDVSKLSTLIGPAITVAMLGAIQSLMSAVVADKMTNDKHNPNVELVAQGVVNIVAPMFGGLPSTGALARTVTNIRAGAKTPWAGVIHALVLMGILLFATKASGAIPLSVLAAILLMTAYNMGEWHEIKNIFRMTNADVVVWAITFGLTVFADLTVAVQAGMALASLLYISRVTKTTTVSRVDDDYFDQGAHHVLHAQDLPAGVAIFRIHGPFLFGATDKIDAIEEQLESLPPVVVLRLRNMTAIDGTGVQALEELHRKVIASGRYVLMCGARPQPESTMRRYGVTDWLGEENMCPNIHSAVKRALEILQTTAAN